MTIIGTTTVSTTVTANTTTALTLLGTCPAGITTSAGTAVIGGVGANAPKSGSQAVTLGAELNLNPTLVATQDDCGLNTFEGFEVTASWQNPGAYVGGAVIGGANAIPAQSVAQILFPTSVLSFQAFIVPVGAAGDGVQLGAHFNLTFPSLPTSLAVCLTGTPLHPANPTALSFGVTPTVLAGAPFLPTGSGNPADSTLRSLDSRTGAFPVKVGVFNGATNLTGSPFTTPSCAIAANTTAPAFALTTCGDG